VKRYEFKDFCKGTLVEKKEPRKDVKLYSSLIPYSVPYVLKAMFLNKYVLIVGGVGLGAIALGLLENKLAKEGNEVGANLVSTTGAIIFPVIVYGGFIIFIVQLTRLFMGGLW
jgi:hypothetical protein